MFEVNLMGDKYKVNACKTKYLVDGSLAVVLTRKKENFADLTVNVGLEPTNKNCAFVDTNNNKWAEAFLKDNKIATPTGRVASSGFCLYPEYCFNMSKLKDLEDDMEL